MTKTIEKSLLIYVAGPYSPRCPGGIDIQLRKVEENIRAAVKVAEQVLAKGHAPFIPHTHTNGFAVRTDVEQSYELYLGWDTVILPRCDAIVLTQWPPRFGYLREWKRAKALGLIMFKKVEDIPVCHTSSGNVAPS